MNDHNLLLLVIKYLLGWKVAKLHLLCFALDLFVQEMISFNSLLRKGEASLLFAF